MFFLVQSWIDSSSYYFSFNGVTWFLSTYIFLSIMTIPILKILKKCDKTKHSKTNLVFIQILLCVLSILLVYIIRTKNISDRACEFWIYIFPPARLIEYTIGIICGILYKKLKDINFKLDNIIFSILEVLAIIFLYFTVSKLMYIQDITKLFYWRFNMWILPMICIIFVFAYQKGIISKILKLRPFVYLGKISMYMFLIHQPLIRYISLKGLPIHYRYLGLYMLILTIILSSIVYKMDKYKAKCKKIIKN